MTQKLDSSKKTGEEILQAIEPKGIADESMRRTGEILLNLIEQYILQSIIAKTVCLRQKS
ncbi:hypothetical protein [Nostoc sp.]|uniref:hypothetical protein n=1 Tax=Nostoc sp. TaxID=1180 RepID=UPI0035940112